LARRIVNGLDRFGQPLGLLATRLFMAAFLWSVAPAAAALLVPGLATRVVAAAAAAFLLAAGMMGGGPPELAYWLMALGLLVLHSGGVLSADEPIDRLLRRRFPQLSGKPAFSLDEAPHIVIVGAGFGGLAAARALRWAKARITLIDRRNYHLFQPLLYQVATPSLSPAAIAPSIPPAIRDQAT